MNKFILSACVGVLWTSLAAGQTPPKRITTYNVQGTWVEASTKIKKNNEFDPLMRKYLLPTFAKALEGTPYINSVQFMEGKEVKGTTYEFLQYTEWSRKSHLVVALSVPSRVSMMFEVNEELRRCNVPEKTPAPICDDHSGCTTPSASGDCQLKSSLVVRGPIAVYGVHDSTANVRQLGRALRKQQYLRVALGKSSDKADVEMETRFDIDSVNWERNLFKFMEAFNIPTQIELASKPSLNDSTTYNAELTRHTMFVGIARVARQLNEKILDERNLK